MQSKEKIRRCVIYHVYLDCTQAYIPIATPRPAPPPSHNSSRHKSFSQQHALPNISTVLSATPAAPNTPTVSP